MLPAVSSVTRLSPMDVTALVQLSSDGVGLSPVGGESDPSPRPRWLPNLHPRNQTHHPGSLRTAGPGARTHQFT